MNSINPIHPHEPAITPQYDTEGRCLICAMLCEQRERLDMIVRICSSLKHKNPLRDIMRECRRGQPQIICLCGSTRFIETFAITQWELERKGNIVLGCTLLPQSYCAVEHHFAEHVGCKDQCDDLHKRKIDLADEVLVLNVDGYIGESTRSEIAYAEANGKPVRYLQPLNATLCDPARGGTKCRKATLAM